MDQEFSLEALPFEIDPEFDGEFLEEQGAWGRRGPRRGGPGTGFRPRGPIRPRPRPIPPGRKPMRGKVGPRRPWTTLPTPYPYPVDPTYAAAPAGSERIRWAQDCLNQVLGLQIAVTGIMGPDARSAVRSFQQERGLRVSGIVGPDTVEALRTACDDRSGRREVNGEIQQELGPIEARLTWRPRLYSLDEARRVPGGGLYIVVHPTDNNLLLKVGETNQFRTRFKASGDYGPGGRYGSEYGGPLRFYLAESSVIGGGGHNPQKMIEHAIARLLIRAGHALPEHQRSRNLVRVEDSVKIFNPLPVPLRDNLGHAYRGTPSKVMGSYPKGKTALTLDPAIYPRWELPPW